VPAGCACVPAAAPGRWSTSGRHWGLARRSGYSSREVSALNWLGDALRATGDLPAAGTRHDAALRLAGELANVDQQARALDGLAHVQQETGQRDLARQSWQAALTRYAELGVPEADEVRRRFAPEESATLGIAR